MDDELKAYLDSMESRLASMDGRLASMDGRLASMDGRLDAMEARLINRINELQEKMLEGFVALDKRMANFERAIGAIIEVQRTTNTLLSSVATSLGDLAGRVTRLEGKHG